MATGENPGVGFGDGMGARPQRRWGAGSGRMRARRAGAVALVAAACCAGCGTVAQWMFRPKVQWVCQVQVQDAANAEAEQTVLRLEDALRNAGIGYSSVEQHEATRVEDAGEAGIMVKGISTEKARAFGNLISERFGTWVAMPLDSTGYTLRLKPAALAAISNEAVEQTVQVVTRRFELLGMTSRVARQSGPGSGPYQLVVLLPGIDNPARVKELAVTTAALGIHEVKDGPFPSREMALAKAGGVLPARTMLIETRRRTAGVEAVLYLVDKIPVVTGRDIRHARPGQDEMRHWETSFDLSPDGGRRFGKYTEANIGNKLAVVLDGQAVSVATIQSRIEDSGRITALASEEEAVDLSRYLRSGSLPARLLILSEKGVGP